jgi:hypothetical protein
MRLDPLVHLHHADRQIGAAEGQYRDCYSGWETRCGGGKQVATSRELELSFSDCSLLENRCPERLLLRHRIAQERMVFGHSPARDKVDELFTFSGRRIRNYTSRFQEYP